MRSNLPLPLTHGVVHDRDVDARQMTVFGMPTQCDTPRLA